MTYFDLFILIYCLQQEFSQLSGEMGLEAADGGDVNGDAAERRDEVDQDNSSTTNSVSDDEHSDSSSPENPIALQPLGVEATPQDKAIIMKAFLDGSISTHNDLAREEFTAKAQTRRESDDVFNVTKNDFSTPPTKSFLQPGAADLIDQDPLTSPHQEREAVTSNQISVTKIKARFQRQASFKSSGSSKRKFESSDVQRISEYDASEDGGPSYSQRNQRNTKMVFIIFLCASTFVVYNVATYLYLAPVKLGSDIFSEMRTLLELQSNLDLPSSRFFPILLHVVQLMNPSLQGIDRQIQGEHLSKIIINFKDSLSRWQGVYSSNVELSSTLRDELSIGNSMCRNPCESCKPRICAVIKALSLHTILPCFDRLQVELLELVCSSRFRVAALRKCSVSYFRPLCFFARRIRYRRVPCHQSHPVLPITI
jgi:hypothetical protein